MSMAYERLSRELKYDGITVSFYEDTLKLPNGNTVFWDHLAHKRGGAAAAIPVLPDGKILMVRQIRNSLDRYTLEIPAGGLNTPDEDPMLAAKRELEEETGYKCGKIEFLMRIRVAVAYCDEKIDIYVATDLSEGEQSLDEDEFITFHAFSVEELCEKIYSGEIEDAKTISAIMAYKDKYM